MNNTYTYTQVILFDLPLPSLLLDFKNNVNSFLIPKINSLIRDIQNKQSNSSIVTLVTLILLIYLIKQIFTNIFTGKKVVSKPVTQSQVDQEIRSLGNQIKSLKNSLKKITQQAANSENKIQLKQQATKSSINPDDVCKLINIYQETAEDFNLLADYVIDTQQTIFKELKYVKKLRAPGQRTSSHGSKEDYNNQTYSQPKQLPETQMFEPQAQPQVFMQDKQAERKKEVIKVQLDEGEQRKQQVEVVEPVAVKKMRPPAPPGGAKRKLVPPPPVPR